MTRNSSRFERQHSKRREKPSTADLEDLAVERHTGWHSTIGPVARHPHVRLTFLASVLCVAALILNHRLRTDFVPQSTPESTIYAIGAVTVTGICGVVFLWGMHHRNLRWIGVGICSLIVAALVAFIGYTDARRTGHTIAVISAIVALRGFFLAWRRFRRHRLVAGFLAPPAALALSVMAAMLPYDTIDLIPYVVVAVTGTLLMMAVATAFDPNTATAQKIAASPNFYRAWLRHQKTDDVDRDALYAKLRYEGAEGYRRLVQFMVLITLSSAIAALGIITNSTAIVIGAMLVAPLMAPLMGAALSLTMGWPQRFARSIAVAVCGTFIAVGVGFLLGVVSPVLIDTAANDQITSRSVPTVLDLAVAAAAGAAGAYGLCRTELSDALPGVAISISLVPPLAAVGISYSQGDYQSGNGAALLYLTNMVAILVLGALVFTLMGVTPIDHLFAQRSQLQALGAAVFTVLVIVTGGLFLNGRSIGQGAFDQSHISAVVQDAIANDSSIRVEGITVNNDDIEIIFIGPESSRPDVQLIAANIAKELNREVTVTARHVLEEQQTSTATPTATSD